MTVDNGAGQSSQFSFYPDGRAVGNWQVPSDERIKDVHGRIEGPLEKMRKIRGLHWTRLDTGLGGYGFTAQDVQAVFPDAVNKAGKITLKDGTVIEDVLSPDTYGVSAALHHEAILALMDENEAIREDNNKLHDELDALKLLVQQLIDPAAEKNQ
ncbi:tail fiber domain-containing protein [Escherichia coli]|nr:tail fiber domain-containing protein [Escherichia coli]